jgi:protocatechuate 3,4-dioxygenase beta subunit
MRSVTLTTASFILAFCLMPEAYGQSRESKPATGSISGRVMLGEQPAAGVTVAATPKHLARSPYTRLLQAVTDREGHFRLTSLAAGAYTVSALAPGFVVPDEAASFSEGKSVTVGEGESLDDVNFSIKRGGVITGSVTDENRAPIPEIRVNLLRLTEQGQWQNFYVRNPFMSSTDDRGVYRIYGLPAGRYKIYAGESPKGGTIMIGRGNSPHLRSYYPDAVDETKAEIIEIRDGGEANNVDIWVNGKIKTYTATGRVIHAATGKPISNVLYGYGAVYAGYGTEKEQAQGSNLSLGASGWTGNRTNARGEFRVEGIVPGRYAVFIVREEGAELYSEPAMFEVKDANISGLEMKVRTGISISGVAVLEGAYNAAITSMLPQFLLAVEITPRALDVNNGNSAKISADGTFRFSGLRPGRAQIRGMNRPGSRTFTLLRIEHNGVEVKDSLDLKEGEPITDMRIVLAHGTATIRGQVKVENGELPEGLRLFVMARRLNKNEGGMEVDRRGRFALENAIAGQYELTLHYMTPPEPGNRPIRPMKQMVTVGEGAEVQVTFVVDLGEKKEGQ